MCTSFEGPFEKASITLAFALSSKMDLLGLDARRQQPPTGKNNPMARHQELQSSPVLFVLAQGPLLALREPLRGALARRDVVDLGEGECMREKE